MSSKISTKNAFNTYGTSIEGRRIHFRISQQVIPVHQKFLQQRNPGCPQSMQERKIIKETFIFKASIFIKQCCPQPVCCECVKYMACYTAYLSHVIVNLLVYQAMQHDHSFSMPQNQMTLELCNFIGQSKILSRGNFYSSNKINQDENIT